MDVVERIKAWFRETAEPLPDEVERLLSTYYWDGATPVPHRVRNVSPSGAYIVTPEKWYPGTIMNLSLESGPRPAEKAELPRRGVGVRARVVSHGLDGVNVEFVYVNRQERETLRKFLDYVRSGGCNERRIAEP